MRLIAIAFAATGLLAAASSATAAAAVSDVEFLKASRCRGLADSGLTQVDTAAMDAFIRNERSVCARAQQGRVRQGQARSQVGQR